MQIISGLDGEFDMIFADPPYFLSNDGISFSNGKVVSVNKGEWDRGRSSEEIDEFNLKWISACKSKLKDNGTIWISGTFHNIFSVGKILSDLGFKILNVVTWVKNDPPPNITHRMLTYSAEYIIWAKKSKKAFHRFNYEIMQNLNNGNQMTDVWKMSAVEKWEKSCGKHPTQKPLPLLSRIILASTKEGDVILDPFNGSGTTGIAANLLGRKYIGIDQDTSFLNLSKSRREELDNPEIRLSYQEKVLQECHSNVDEVDSNLVLIGRVGSEEQWNWIHSSRLYNLPIDKILSLPKVLSARYVLLFQNGNSKRCELYRVGKINPVIKTKEQIWSESQGCYQPKRSDSYWVLGLVDINKTVKDKYFNSAKLLTSQEQRGAYWIKPLSLVINAFENNNTNEGKTQGSVPVI